MVLDSMLDKVVGKFLDAWQAAADLRTYRQAVAEAIAFRISEGESFDLTPGAVAGPSQAASWYEAREKAEAMGIDVTWDCERGQDA